MKIQFTDLLQFKNDYVAIARQLRTQDMEVLLTFSEPVELHYSKYMRDNKMATQHTVKRRGESTLIL